MQDSLNALSPDGKRAVSDRSASLLNRHQLEIWKRTDRLFVGLLIFEWLAGIVLALILSPRTWDGAASSIHPHVWQAIFLGFCIIAAPVCFGLARPGEAFTRNLIAFCQMLFSALLIHLGNGRIEMHFHVFGSLAFLAFYRDWRVLITATIVIAADHFFRGMYFPTSVFGFGALPGGWRWLEHAGWVIFEDVFLIASCRQGVREMGGIALHQALLEHSYRTVEEKVTERTRELKEAQAELLTAARSAGKAEIAMSVLHNVGNVLNSVNVAVDTAIIKVQESPVQNLALVVQALDEHKADLPQYLGADQQGRQITGYLASLSEIMTEEQKAILSEMSYLAKHVEQIQQIIGVQQQYARQVNDLETIDVKALLDDALSVISMSVEKSGIRIVRDYGSLPPIVTDKHAVLQILLNLINNAKHALAATGRPVGTLTIRTRTAATGDNHFARVQIIDDGVGIEQSNLIRIFVNGFTTKGEGHGFGLHSSANTAKQLRGSLTAFSEGLGAGATFTLDLPLKLEGASL